jgi:hypothetical protein
MKTRFKCSNCGAEISNITMGWGKKDWLWSFLFLIFIFSALFLVEFMMTDRNDFRDDLSLKNIEQQYVNGTIEISGVIENNGKVEWEDVVVEAELFSADNKFLDEIPRRIYTSLAPGSSEHFQIQEEEFCEDRWNEIKEIKVKVSDATHPRY